jgi:hypothetical protein
VKEATNVLRFMKLKPQNLVLGACSKLLHWFESLLLLVVTWENWRVRQFVRLDTEWISQRVSVNENAFRGKCLHMRPYAPWFFSFFGRAYQPKSASQSIQVVNWVALLSKQTSWQANSTTGIEIASLLNSLKCRHEAWYFLETRFGQAPI